MSPEKTEQPPIPDKLYFRIGEVSKIAGVPAHVLRFWETEFKKIAPKRTRTGQRLYTQRDIRLILEIKRLLYEKRFTIKGARQHLGAGKPATTGVDERVLADIRTRLQQIRDLLD